MSGSSGEHSFCGFYALFLGTDFDDLCPRFIPSEKEMAETYLHQADARKNRLQKRFGHPSLHDALFTPMLHQDIAHLLPTMLALLMAFLKATHDTNFPAWLTDITVELRKAKDWSMVAQWSKTQRAVSNSICWLLVI